MFYMKGIRSDSVFPPEHGLILNCWSHSWWVFEFSLAGREGMWQLPIDDYLINVLAVTVLSNLLSSENSTSK